MNKSITGLTVKTDDGDIIITDSRCQSFIFTPETADMLCQLIQEAKQDLEAQVSTSGGDNETISSLEKKNAIKEMANDLEKKNIKAGYAPGF